ncbi:hypothetical protein [Butyricimonas synergistica]|uniref:hypothetical protein n=1 Tax=Butyricimonas synergistica TaxID=544644 RepID=UPI00039F7A21|nr:hypothetical protein [Butyricimonas synergistica]
MKAMFFMISIFIFIACGEEGKLINDFVAKQEKPLTKETKKALDEAMEREFEKYEGASRSGTIPAGFSGVLLTRERYERLIFTQLPLYVFDVEKFVQNPCEEHMMECIRPSEDQLLFGGRRDGKLVMSVSIEKIGGHWSKGTLGITGESDFARNYEKLPSVLERVDDHQVFFLNYRGHVRLMYKVDGVQYFSVVCGGRDITKAKFAEMVLDDYNVCQKNLKWVEEQEALRK